MVGLIHQTDLFHPHGDPDDHFDLAVLYALAGQGLVDLKLIVGDYPPAHRVGDPAFQAVAQLNTLSGFCTPMCVGTPHRMQSPTDTQPYAAAHALGGVRHMAQVLQNAAAPIYITVVGSAVDIALLGLHYPQLLKEKCKGILLNSGSGVPNDTNEPAAEYNVKLNAAAYAALFALPCPIYWFPCYHMVKPNWVELPGEYGTVYSFSQATVLNKLDPRLQNYFLYMLEKSADPQYLRYLFQPPSKELLEHYGALPRRMWSTPSFLFLCGLQVNQRGEIVPLADTNHQLYRMEPTQITCDAAGQTHWQQTPTPQGNLPPRYLFHIINTAAYNDAMVKALTQLLQGFTPPI